ncbi:DNA (cytosine-5-)-methyltransferase [Clostridium sp.]|uniref:DNA (cytosine-5-)-methyltransferase n=1 Tax=Clostridium sp. TaxID=1506 RepID=UPI00262C0CEC|nr:DNA (cytosine-5-)-methyltransferase [Clostridium sp.]
MYKNILEKLNFQMEEIKLFDSFAGIGSLHQSLKELGVPVKLTGISEIDIDAIIAYAAIHIENFKDLEFEYPSDDEMKKYLMDKNIGYNFDKKKSLIPRMKKNKLKLCYKATILTNNMGDVSSLDFDKIPDSDLFNFSFCCQDVSGAGQQKGFKNEDGTLTRSGLVKYGIEAIKVKRFKYIMIENVKGLIQKKFIDDFYGIVEDIKNLGYNCYYPKKDKGQPTCLNAKNYGIPQNRERVFVICIREDIDNNNFQFPIGKDYGVRLKDLLEEMVEEKYYLSQEIQERFKFNGNEDIDRNELNQIGTTGENKTIGQRDRTYGTNGIIANLTSTDYKQPKQILDSTINNSVLQIGNCMVTGKRKNPNQGRVYDKEGLSPSLTTMEGGGRQPHVLDDNSLKFIGGIDSDKTDKWIDNGKELSRNYKEGYRVYDSEGISACQKTNGGGLGSNTGLYIDKNKVVNLNDNEESPKPELVGGIGKINFGKQYRQGNRVYSSDKTAMCLMSQPVGNTGGYSYLYNIDYRIRKLTPKECWLLMGFRSEHIDKVKELGISDSALYKLAGNSIVVNCLYFIFKELFKEYII